MYYPDFKQFRQMVQRGNIVPVYRELLADMETPVSAFLKIDRGNAAFLLESVEGGETIARYSFLGANTSVVFRSKGNVIELCEQSAGGRRKVKKYTAATDPLQELRELVCRYQSVPVPGLPRFCGGLVGYVSYDAVRFFEVLPDKNPDDLAVPDLLFILTDSLIVFDHVAHTMKIVSNVHVPEKKQGYPEADLRRIYRQALADIDRQAERLSRPLVMKKKSAAAVKTVRIRSNVTRQRFAAAVKKAKEYICAGDIIQTVLSQRFSAAIHVAPFEIYRALRVVNPSPYMFYLRFPELTLVGASPEIMVRCEDGTAQVRPIAGTRRRGAGEREDAAMVQELLADPKERAEHIMLVDLGRNDLGRICRPGTVTVRELMAIEKYSHVMHLVSDVFGTLLPDKDAFDVIRATFPAGTVSGAPKIRAMEIIDELETSRRGVYAGCVGYFSFSGNLDSCITIRTILIKNRTAYIQAGAGIVADSDPQREYQETVNKAKALFKAIELAHAGLT